MEQFSSDDLFRPLSIFLIFFILFNRFKPKGILFDFKIKFDFIKGIKFDLNKGIK